MVNEVYLLMNLRGIFILMCMCMYMIEEDELQGASSIFNMLLYSVLDNFGASLGAQGFWECRR